MNILYPKITPKERRMEIIRNALSHLKEFGLYFMIMIGNAMFIYGFLTILKKI